MRYYKCPRCGETEKITPVYCYGEKIYDHCEKCGFPDIPESFTPKRNHEVKHRLLS